MEIDARPIKLRAADLADDVPALAFALADQRRERVREKVFHRGTSARGPLPDSVGSDHVPTLVQGRDPLPTTCKDCGSGFLAVEPPLGRQQRGSVNCNMCSRTLCWLAAPIGTLRPVSHIAPAPSREAAQREQPRRVSSGLFGWTEGCGRRCSVVYGHEPLTHEAYGRQSALADQAVISERPRGQRCSGPMRIDFDAGQVWLSGVELASTANELHILMYLMSRAGELVTHRELAESVWGKQQADLWEIPGRRGRWHTLRVNISRVRSKLGSASNLLTTLNHQGYRLLVEPAL